MLYNALIGEESVDNYMMQSPAHAISDWSVPHLRQLQKIGD